MIRLWELQSQIFINKNSVLSNLFVRAIQVIIEFRDLRLCCRMQVGKHTGIRASVKKLCVALLYPFEIWEQNIFLIGYDGK